eukprot:jgi/Mesvir1/24544/Mv21882-RA.1
MMKKYAVAAILPICACFLASIANAVELSSVETFESTNGPNWLDDDSPREETIRIAMMNTHWLGSDLKGSWGKWNLNGGGGPCKWRNININCIYEGHNPEQADVLWYFIPTMYSTRELDDWKNKRVIAGLCPEPASFYPQLASPDFMNHFDIELSYRATTHIVPDFIPTYDLNYDPAKMFRPPLPTPEKINAVVYMNSNCGGRRNRLVQNMMAAGIKVDSYGGCLTNSRMDAALMALPKFDAKIELFRRYRFCIASENSEIVDYFSEKLPGSLQAGCLPIYLGAPNIQDFLPVPARQMMLHVLDFKTEDELFAEIQRLSADDNAYDRYFEWKRRPEGPFLPLYERHIGQFLRGDSSCQLCQLVVERRLVENKWVFNGTHVRR